VCSLQSQLDDDPVPVALEGIADGGVPHVPDNPGRDRRTDWAELLKRVWSIDVFVCPDCAGPMRVVSVIQDENVARRILDHLGSPARAPPRGRRSVHSVGEGDPTELRDDLW
jgi:hypothetical protein